MKKIPVKRLQELAFVWAEQDRAGLADAWGYETPEGKKALDEAKQLREYRLKRWGKSRRDYFDDSLKSTESVPINKLNKLNSDAN